MFAANLTIISGDVSAASGGAAMTGPDDAQASDVGETKGSGTSPASYHSNLVRFESIKFLA
jgi:hypothetical protein